MYSLQTAYVRERSVNADWMEIDLTTTTIAQAMTLYRNIYLVLTHPVVAGEQILDFIAYAGEMTYRSETFEQWLTFNGNGALPTVTGTIAFERSYVKYKDAFQAKFHVRCVNPDTHPDVPAPRSLLKDLLVFRPDTDYTAVSEKALFTCGGIIHRSYPTPEGIRVVNAGESLAISNNNNLGVISFQDIGKVNQIEITADNLSRVIVDQPLYHTVMVDLGMDVSDMQLGLVLCGRLHILDGVIAKNGPTTALIYLSKIKVRELYHYLFDKINISDILEQFFDTDVLFPQDEPLLDEQFMTDEFIMALMTKPQTFVVAIESDTLNKRVRGIEVCHLPFTAFDYSQVPGIIMSANRFTVAARVVRYNDVDKINGEIRLNNFPARWQAPDQEVTGASNSPLPARLSASELDHILQLGVHRLVIQGT